MKTFYCDDFTGMNPVGTSAIVTAKNKDEALIMLNLHLKENGLLGDAKELKEFDTKSPNVVVISDGDY